MPDTLRYTLFSGSRRLASGDLSHIAVAAHEASSEDADALLAISDQTGRVIDLDLRGAASEVQARYAEPMPPKAARGRPKLGVVAREVTLLPRDWEWLATQPGGASAALRRLIDQARRDLTGSQRRREAQEAAHRVMTTLAGDLVHYEEALRAFYAGEKERFGQLVAPWPKDIGDYVQAHAKAAWTDSNAD